MFTSSCFQLNVAEVCKTWLRHLHQQNFYESVETKWGGGDDESTKGELAEDEAAARAPCHVGEVLSSSNFGQTGLVMALDFPLVISYDFFFPKVVKLFFF